MNVLILTPDAVGSTLLQRMLTIYMQLHEFDRPVINLHELTNGLAKYYSPEFNRELVGKRTLEKWGYYQTLPEIVDILSSVDHYKTSRLAHYHLLNRGDSINHQIPFYNYLNENFYIIACRRANVFEHAVSMTMNKIHKKLNVYAAQEKIESFYDLYSSGLSLDTEVFVSQLNRYKDYINWSQQYFNVARYFNYESDVPNLEKFILNLPVFSSQPQKITWEKNFGISFNNWNRMHYAASDLGSVMFKSLALNSTEILKLKDFTHDYQQHAPEEWPPVYSSDDLQQLPEEIKTQWIKQVFNQQGVSVLWDQPKQQLFQQLKANYNTAQQTIDQMIELGIIINGPPIKKQTFAEKKQIVHNFQELLKIYNDWAEQNPDIAQPITDESMQQDIKNENNWWDLLTNAADAVPALPPSQQFSNQNDDRLEPGPVLKLQ